MQQTIGSVSSARQRHADREPTLRERAAALQSALLTEGFILFTSFFSLYLAAGCYIAIWLRVFHWDTVARTALGYFVIYGREPKLASIGFIWPPLFSLLQLPIFPLLRLADLSYLAGIVLSSIFGAGTIVLLNRLGTFAEIPRAIRLPVVVLFGLHPTILLYAATGMTEISLCFFMVAAAVVLLRWVSSDSRHTLLMSVGLALALALLVRYESLPLLAAVYGIVVLVTLLKPGQTWRAKRTALEAVSITVLTPGVYALTIWILVNWLIMGDPLYFYRGPYIKITASEQFQAPVEQVTGQLWGATLYALERIQAQFVLFVPLLIAGIAIAVWRRSLRPLIPLLLPLSLIAFHIYFRYSSFGWYRFYIYAVPGAVVAFFWLLTFLRDQPAKRVALQVAMIAGLVVSMPITTRAMSNPELGKEEWTFMDAIYSGGTAPQEETRSFAIQREVAEYIDQRRIEGPILLDTVSGFGIVLFSDQPRQFVITQNRDFETALLDPVGQGIRWVLVPNANTSDGYYELILKTYPKIWEGGVPWARLERDFGAWRLFRVTSGEEDAPLSSAPTFQPARAQQLTPSLLSDIPNAAAPQQPALLVRPQQPERLGLATQSQASVAQEPAPAVRPDVPNAAAPQQPAPAVSAQQPPPAVSAQQPALAVRPDVPNAAAPQAAASQSAPSLNTPAALPRAGAGDPATGLTLYLALISVVVGLLIRHGARRHRTE
ncbi:MAG: hypothetical protein RLZZ387_880 [Chloroflexota bacterium]|jgi:hypothetical protein